MQDLRVGGYLHIIHIGGDGFEDNVLVAPLGPSLIEYDVARFKEALSRATHKALAVLFFRDMNQGPGTKNTEARHVWFAPAPGILGRDPFECACGHDVVEHDRMLEHVVPLSFGERGVVKHAPDVVQEHVVHALGDAVVRSHCVCVIASSIGTQGLKVLARFELGMRYEGFQVINYSKPRCDRVGNFPQTSEKTRPSIYSACDSVVFWISVQVRLPTRQAPQWRGDGVNIEVAKTAVPSVYVGLCTTHNQGSFSLWGEFLPISGECVDLGPLPHGRSQTMQHGWAMMYRFPRREPSQKD